MERLPWALPGVLRGICYWRVGGRWAGPGHLSLGLSCRCAVPLSASCPAASHGGGWEGHSWQSTGPSPVPKPRGAVPESRGHSPALHFCCWTQESPRPPPPRHDEVPDGRAVRTPAAERDSQQLLAHAPLFGLLRGGRKGDTRGPLLSGNLRGIPASSAGPHPCPRLPPPAPPRAGLGTAGQPAFPLAGAKSLGASWTAPIPGTVPAFLP